jgi:hypothetical protein
MGDVTLVRHLHTLLLLKVTKDECECYCCPNYSSFLCLLFRLGFFHLLPTNML